MSYGYADKINAQTSKGQADQSGGQAGQAPVIDPAVWDRPDLRSVLSTRDISALYQELIKLGVSQYRIAQLTGQSQSEIWEIVKGRRVIVYDVHKRIADGLGIPHGRMGLAYDVGYEPEQDSGQRTQGEGASPKETPEEMKRRILIGTTSLMGLGQVVAGLGELAELALPTEKLPSRLTLGHVRAVENVTVVLNGLARQSGGQGGLFGVAAQYYSRWLAVPATEALQARLCAALAELYTDAGYCCYDSGMDGAGYFTRALKMANKARDAFGIAYAAWTAGVTLVRAGHPNDALQEFQLGELVLKGFTPGKTRPILRPDDPRLPALTAQLDRESATACALMNRPDQAKRYLAKAHDGHTPGDAYGRGTMDLVTASVARDLGQLDSAHQFAASAVRAYGNGYSRCRTKAELLLAEVHVRAGEPRGVVLARPAIEAVRALQSVSVRRIWLVPLITALETRPGSDAKELARTARQIAATQE